MLRGLADVTGRSGSPAGAGRVGAGGPGAPALLGVCCWRPPRMGSLLRADPAVLAGTPFSDWRVPGVLLAGLAGGGFLLAGWRQWRGHRYARELSMAAGAGAGVLRGRRAGMDRVP